MRFIRLVTTLALVACGEGGATSGADGPTPDAASDDGGGEPDAHAPAGPCSVTPVKLGEFPYGVRAIAVQGDVFVLLRDGIHRIPRDGGAAVAVVPFGDPRARTTNLVVDRVRLYWTDFEAILSVPVRGGQADFLLNERSTGKLRVVGAHLYFGYVDMATTAGLARMLKSGGAVETLVPASVRDFVVDDSHVYWTSTTEIRRMPLEGKPPGELIAPQEGRRFLIGVDGTHLYARTTDYTVSRVAKGAGGWQTLGMAIDANSEAAFGVADGRVYWTSERGKLHRMGADGVPELRAEFGTYDDDDTTPVLAFDDSSVYFQGGPPGIGVSDEAPVWLYRLCK